MEAPVELCGPWAAPEDTVGTGDCPGPGADVDSDALEAGLLEASEFLFTQSGRRWPGTCTASGADAARPCSTSPDGGFCFHGNPAISDSTIRAIACGTCACTDPGDCGCCGPTGVTLGFSPVLSVTEVRLDGDVLGTDEWRLVGDILVRLDPDDPTKTARWPCCQRVDLPDTEQDTFAVDFTWGADPPHLGVRAAIDLGVMLAKAACGDETCKPAQNLVRKTASGVTVEVASPTADLVRSLPLTVRMFLEPDDSNQPARGPRIRRPAVGHSIRTS